MLGRSLLRTMPPPSRSRDRLNTSVWPRNSAGKNSVAKRPKTTRRISQNPGCPGRMVPTINASPPECSATIMKIVNAPRSATRIDAPPRAGMLNAAAAPNAVAARNIQNPRKGP